MTSRQGDEGVNSLLAHLGMIIEICLSSFVPNDKWTFIKQQHFPRIIVNNEKTTRDDNIKPTNRLYQFNLI